jgi:hypothetical protein
MTTRSPNALRIAVVHYTARGNVCGENPYGGSFTESYTGTSVTARHLSQEGRSAPPKPSSCSQLPDHPASVRATRRSD